MAGPVNASEPVQTLERIRIVPVLTIDNVDQAAGVARTLMGARVATAEVTLRTPEGLDAIRAMSKIDGFLAGAGTVLSPADVDAAVDAGAAYLVSPGLDERVIERATDRGIPIVPGVATASEVQRGYAAGLTHLKLFPAGTVGGRGLIDALAGPFPQIRFLPSGGVTRANMTDYLASPSVFAISGSWMVPRAAVNSGDLETIARLTADAVAALEGD